MKHLNYNSLGEENTFRYVEKSAVEENIARHINMSTQHCIMYYVS